MRPTDVATTILAAVERRGVLLVHDRTLPSVTSLVTGGPVAGSWWAHPQANDIYNALVDLEGRGVLASVKLIVGKETLVARRLWPHVVAIGSAREAWQLHGLGDAPLALLGTVERSEHPVAIDRTMTDHARLLERRLLAHGTSVHTPDGTHRKALTTWVAWAVERNLAPVGPSAALAREELAAIVASYAVGGRRSLLPWPQ